MPKAQRQLRLNQTQRWALYKWIDANYQDFHGKADSEIAEMAHQALGFRGYERARRILGGANVANSP